MTLNISQPETGIVMFVAGLVVVAFSNSRPEKTKPSWAFAGVLIMCAGLVSASYSIGH